MYVAPSRYSTVVSRLKVTVPQWVQPGIATPPLHHSTTQSTNQNARMQVWPPLLSATSGRVGRPSLPLFTLTLSATQQLSLQYPVLTPLSQPTNIPLNRKAKLAFFSSAAAGALRISHASHQWPSPLVCLVSGMQAGL